MHPDLFYTISKLANDAFARDVIVVALSISGVNIFNSPAQALISEQCFKISISCGVNYLSLIPGFGFKFDVDFPVGVFF
jgi:hypothetical protein